MTTAPDHHELFAGILPPEPSVPAPAHRIAGKHILITGAGGSIGSALAHAVATHQPEIILLLESSEQALYQIDRALAAPHHSILASISDTAALEDAFTHYRPHIVFHAAAFKHVSLMEQHPFAAIENNTIGTFTLANTAIRHRVQQFMLVSTDKAADPTSIMGASKRIAELTALALEPNETSIKAVRLGNVYASQGSVVPLFQQQIAQGESVTVTHPEATRYFLSLNHAAALLLHALSQPGQILAPAHMPSIRIEDIAKSLIQQARSKSKIIHTGLRPGEKLHEQILATDESFLNKDQAPLRAIQSKIISVIEAEKIIRNLKSAIQTRNLTELLRIVNELIPAYQPSETLLAQIHEECRA